MLHKEPHPNAGQIVQVAIHPSALPTTLHVGMSAGTDPHGMLLFDFRIEDWEDRVMGAETGFWDRPAQTHAQSGYAFRCGMAMALGVSIPHNNEVLYGKIGSFGYIVNETEILHSF